MPPIRSSKNERRRRLMFQTSRFAVAVACHVSVVPRLGICRPSTRGGSAQRQLVWHIAAGTSRSCRYLRRLCSCGEVKCAAFANHRRQHRTRLCWFGCPRLGTPSDSHYWHKGQPVVLSSGSLACQVSRQREWVVAIRPVVDAEHATSETTAHALEVRYRALPRTQQRLRWTAQML